MTYNRRAVHDAQVLCAMRTWFTCRFGADFTSPTTHRLSRCILKRLESQEVDILEGTELAPFPILHDRFA
jgi:hypothetical protein